MSELKRISHILNREFLALHLGRIVLFVLLIFQVTISMAQETDQEQGNPLYVITSDHTLGINKGAISYLSGNVILRQDSIVMYADSVVMYPDSNLAIAMGRVVIQRDDSTAAFADYVRYEGNLGFAKMKGNVVLERGEKKLFSNRLDYNLITNVGDYDTPSLLAAEDGFVSSKKGKYIVDSSLVILHDSVVGAGEFHTLRSDSIHFHVNSRKMELYKPTKITYKTDTIYSERGYYLLNENYAYLYQNAQFAGEVRKASGDTITYYGRKGDFDILGNGWMRDDRAEAEADKIRFSKAKNEMSFIGGVDLKSDEQTAQGEYIVFNTKTNSFTSKGTSRIWKESTYIEADKIDRLPNSNIIVAEENVYFFDTLERVALRSQYAQYNEETEDVKAFGGKISLLKVMDQDSFLFTADTVLMTTDSIMLDSVVHKIQAYHHVVGFKSDLQFVGDSIYFDDVENIFHLTGDPIVWSDSTQSRGDYMRMTMQDDQIEKIKVIGKAKILNTTDFIFYNQMAGKHIAIDFYLGKVDRMHILGNAETVYYALDDFGAYVGVNDLKCGEIVFQFSENQIKDIRFYKKPTSVFYPITQIDHEKIKLKGMVWMDELQPMFMEDIFRVYEMIKK